MGGGRGTATRLSISPLKTVDTISNHNNVDIQVD